MQGSATMGTESVPASDSQGTGSTPPPAYPAAPPPPRREIRIPLESLPSLIRVLVVCLAVLGIVAALIVPWVHMEMRVGTEDETASYDGKLQRMDEPSEDDGVPDNLGSALSDAGYGDASGYYTRGLAITGFILLLIVLGAAMFLRSVDVLPPRPARAVQVALLGTALLPATMAVVAGMRFIGGFGIAFDSLFNALGAKVDVAAYGGWAVAIIGVFIIVLLVLDLLKELGAARAVSAPGLPSLTGPLAQRVVLAIAVLAIAGIVAVPITPWARYVPEDSEDSDMKPFFQDEGLIHGRADVSGTGQTEAHAMDKDIRHASACFWLALVFSVVAMMAIALDGLGAPRAAVTGVRLAASMAFLFPLLGLLAIVGFMGSLNDIEIAMASGDMQFMAYAPVIIAFVLLMAALVYLAITARGLRGGQRAAYAAPAAGQPAAPAPGAAPVGWPVVEGPFPGGSGSGGKDDSRRG